MSIQASRRFHFEGFTLDAERRQLLHGGRELALRPRSFDVLCCLARHAGQTVDKEVFFGAVWPHAEASDASLARCVSDIRQVLHDPAQRLVKTVPGRGYALAVPVALEPSTHADEAPPPRAAGGASVSVLPFAAHGDDPEEAHLGAGLGEDLAAALCRFSELRVVACQRRPGDAQRGLDLRALGRELGVRYLVDGSVRRLDGRVRVTVHLFDAETASVLWAERHDGAAGGLFEILDEITTRIAGRISPEILSAEYVRSSRKPPHSLDAWDCVIRALFHSSQQSDAETRTALALLDRALQHDPDYARALGMQAWILMFRAFQGWEPMAGTLQRVGPLIARAMAIDNHELWPYLAQAMVGFATRDNLLAMSVLAQAQGLSPGSVNVHGLLCVAHAFGGRFDAALASVEQAMRLSPRDTYLSDFELYRAFAYFQGARYELGLAFARQAHQRRPGHPYPMLLGTACAGHLGRRADGQALLRSLQAVVPGLSAGWVEATSPYVLEADRARLVDGLRRAGLA